MLSYTRPLIVSVSMAVLLNGVFPFAAFSQSGRGRPKVPQPSSSSSPPQPVVVPEATAVLKQEQAGTRSRFVLRNGMTVVIIEQHATPIVASVACFKVDALQDSSMRSAARLLEHIILNGKSERTGSPGIAELRALGAIVEATSSYAGAAYSLLASPEKFKDAMAIQAEMLQNPSIDAASMRREIPVAIQDQYLDSNRGNSGNASQFVSRLSDTAYSEASCATKVDDPAAFSMTRLIDLAFGGPESASETNLRSMTIEQLAAFYQAHYRPDKLIISVVGDVSTFDTLVSIEQLYGAFGIKPNTPNEAKNRVPSATSKGTASPARARPSGISSDQPQANPGAAQVNSSPTPKPESSAQPKVRYASDRFDITQSIVSLGFRVTGASSKDWQALEVLSALAGQGRASRLAGSLIEGQMLANRIETACVAIAGDGLFTVQICPVSESRDAGAIDRAESSLFKELDQLRRILPTDSEVARAKTVLEKRLVDETGTYLGRARTLARAEAAGMEFQLALDLRARIRAVTAEDIRRVAAKYLTLGNTSIHECEPLSAPARTFDGNSFATTVSTWAPGFADAVDTAVARSAEANAAVPVVAQGAERSPEQRMLMESVQPLPVRDFSTLNGPKAFVREDHSQPKVTIAILFQGGRLIEDAQTSGTTELMLRSILYGTARRSFAQVTQELEQLGADVQLIVEPDYFGFILSSLSRNADRALRLVREAIEEPAFRDDDIAIARLAQLSSIRGARDSSAGRSNELLLQALFPGHTYSLPSHGREEVIATLTSETLRDWHQRVIKRQIPVAIVVGDTDGSALVSSQIAEGFKRRDADTVTQVKVPKGATPTEKIEQRRRDQTTIAIGFAGPKADSSDVMAVELIEAALDLEGGSLLRELRDNQNLVSIAHVEDIDMFAGGAIVACEVTAPDNESRARAALLSEFQKIAKGGLTTEDLASARALLATLRVARLQSQTEHAIAYARAIFYQRQATDADTFVDRLSKVTAEDIKRVSSAYFKASAASAGVVRGSSPPPSRSKPN
jgi:zinc protease